MNSRKSSSLIEEFIQIEIKSDEFILGSESSIEKILME